MHKLQPKDSKIFCRGARAAIAPFFKKAAEALWANPALLGVCGEGKGTQEPWLSLTRTMGSCSTRNEVQHLPSRQGCSAQCQQALRVPKEKPPTPGAEDILDLQKADPHLEGLGSQ